MKEDEIRVRDSLLNTWVQRDCAPGQGAREEWIGSGVGARQMEYTDNELREVDEGGGINDDDTQYIEIYSNSSWINNFI